MFKHRMEIVHNHDNNYLHWLLLRESASIMSGNGKGFTLEDIFRSPLNEL